MRICGADVEILETGDDHEKAAKIAIKDERIILTCGGPYESLKNHVPHGYCFKIPNNVPSEEQMEIVIKRYSIIIFQEDLFTRCVKCNFNEFLILKPSELKRRIEAKELFLSKKVAIKHDLVSTATYSQVDRFFICPSCGHIYWIGCHHHRFKDKVEKFLFKKDNSTENHEIITIH